MPYPRSICVYCASSDQAPAVYLEAAKALGQIMAERQIDLIYGGGQVGLMGAVARSVHQYGGRVIGVIPDYLRTKELAYERADQLLVTSGLRERKAVMEQHAGAFITLAGGFGTLEETIECITLKQLKQHDRPIIILNTNGFYEDLLRQFDKFYQESIASEKCQDLFSILSQPADAVNAIESVWQQGTV